MGGFFVAKFVKLPIALYYYVCYSGCKEAIQDTRHMKLYHATPTENAESISEFGIFPTDCGTRSHTGDSLQGKGFTGIYGFLTMDAAMSFVGDNGHEYVIFSFDVDGQETMIDPEYEGEALFVITDEPITELLYTIGGTDDQINHVVSSVRHD